MVDFKLIFTCITLIGILACSPQIAEPVVTAPTPVIPTRPEYDNPCTTLAKLTSAQREEAETAYTLYKDELRMKNLADALPLWQRAFELAPAGEGRMKYQFDDGIKLYKHFFSEAEDPAEKRIFADSILTIYDKRLECHPDDADYVNARLGFDAYYTLGEFVPDNEAYNRLKNSFDSKGKDVEYFIINPFTKILYDKIVAKEIGNEEGRKYANMIFEAVDQGLAECGDKCESWEIINDYAPQRLAALEGLKGFYGCEYYSSKYIDLYNASPEDCEVINDTSRKLKWGDCANDHPGVMQLAEAKAKNCYVAPPPEGPLKRAFNTYNEGKYRDAITLFEEFVNKTDDPAKKAKYTLLIAKIYYGDIKNFPQSRLYALRAAEFRSNWGEPYILIGKLYASSGPLCGPGRGWDSQIVTWPAIDMFRKAKSVDPSVSEEANKWIREYEQYMPKMEDVFVRNLSKGQSFTVGCWIQEKTTIRTAN